MYSFKSFVCRDLNDQKSHDFAVKLRYRCRKLRRSLSLTSNEDSSLKIPVSKSSGLSSRSRSRAAVQIGVSAVLAIRRRASRSFISYNIASEKKSTTSNTVYRTRRLKGLIDFKVFCQNGEMHDGADETSHL